MSDDALVPAPIDGWTFHRDDRGLFADCPCSGARIDGGVLHAWTRDYSESVEVPLSVVGVLCERGPVALPALDVEALRWAREELAGDVMEAAPRKRAIAALDAIIAAQEVTRG